MPAIGRNKRSVRLDKLTDAQIQARWAALLPMFRKCAIFSVILVAVAFLFNHFFVISQRVTDITGVVFQISSVFCVCFSFLMFAALYFRSDAWIKKS